MGILSVTSSPTDKYYRGKSILDSSNPPEGFVSVTDILNAVICWCEGTVLSTKTFGNMVQIFSDCGAEFLQWTVISKVHVHYLNKSTPHKPAILNNLFLASNHETSHLLRIPSFRIFLYSPFLFFSWI